MPSLLPTKFYIPPPPAGFVARPQLLAALDQVLAHRLALVSAPAGAGKTTLVSAWAGAARKNGPAFGWLAVDEGDNDPERFLEYLGACLEESGSGLDASALHAEGSLPREVERDPSEITGSEQARLEGVVGEFVRGLAASRRDFVLILDDYHHIHNPAIHTALEYFLNHLPPRLHLVLLTRSDPPLGLARLRVSGQLVELRMEDLRFSDQEAGMFLEAAGVYLAPGNLAILNTRAEGWVAGLQMAAISLRGRQDTSMFVTTFAGSHRYVFDYLLEQVLDRQPPEVHEFLLRTSVLERFSAPLCEFVAETGGTARSLLDTLERENLFLIPLDDERRWYRYHHLFADLLRLVLERAHPGLSSTLHKWASRWCETQGLLAEALDYALASKDMRSVAEVVSANVLILVEADEAAPTLNKISQVPLEEIASLPWLGIARAWALGSIEAQKSLQTLDRVEQSLEKGSADRTKDDQAELQRLRGHLAAARANVYHTQGDIPQTVQQARLAEELLPREEIAVRALNLCSWGDVLSAERHDPNAMPILEQALGLALQAEKPHVAMIAASGLASAHLNAGRMHEMHHVCLEALRLAEDYQRRYQHPISATASIYPLLARVLAEWGETEKAIETCRRGLRLSELWGQIDIDVICLDYLGRALAFHNDWEQARQVLERADRASEKVSPWLWQMTANFGLDSLLDIDQPAPSEIDRLVRRVRESGGHYPDLLQARLLLRQNQPTQALKVLEHAQTVLAGQPSFDHVRILALRALAYQAKGDEKSALAELRHALEAAEPENRIATFVREGAAMERLLHRALSRGITPAYVTRLLAAFEARRKQKPGGARLTEALVEPLSERELEVLRCLDGPLSTPEIACQLFVSANTVRTHIKSIYGKLGVHGRSGAVRRAKDLRMLE